MLLYLMYFRDCWQQVTDLYLLSRRVYTKGSDGAYVKTENIAVGTIETINNDSVKFAIPEGTEYSFDKQAKQLTFTKLKDNKLTINGHERTFAANEKLVLTLNSTTTGEGETATTSYSVKALVGTVETTVDEKLIKKVRTYDVETGEIINEEVYENNVKNSDTSYEYDEEGNIIKSTENFDDHEIVTEFGAGTKTVTTNNLTKDNDGKITERATVSKITYKVEEGKADVKQSEVDYSGLEPKTTSYGYYSSGKIETATTRLGDNKADGKLLEIANYNDDEDNTVNNSEKHIYELTKETIVTTKDGYSTAEIKDNNTRTAWGLAFGDKIVELPNSAAITDIRTIATLSTDKKEINVEIAASNSLPKFTLKYANEATATCAAGDLISGELSASGNKVTLNPGSTFVTYDDYVVVKYKAATNNDIVRIYDNTLNPITGNTSSPLSTMTSANLFKLVNTLNSFKTEKNISVDLNKLTAVDIKASAVTVTFDDGADSKKYEIFMNNNGVVTGYKETEINANWEITKDYTTTSNPTTEQIKIKGKDIGALYPINTTITDNDGNISVSYSSTDGKYSVSASYSIKAGQPSTNSYEIRIKDDNHKYSIPEGSQISENDGTITVTKAINGNSSLTLNYDASTGAFKDGSLQIAGTTKNISANPGQVIISDSAIYKR